MQELCPRCGQLKPDNTPCRRCDAQGLDADDPPLTAAMASPLDDPLAPPVELPPLELAPVPPPARTSALNRAGQPRMAGLPEPPPMGQAPPPPTHGHPSTPADSATHGHDDGDDGRPLDPDLERQERLRALNRYRPPPESPLHWVPYYVSVFLQRRVVAEELATLTRHRQHAERELVDGLCRIGENLYLRRRDPTLAPLAQHFEVVAQTDSDLDAREATGKQARFGATKALEGLHAKVTKATQAGEPLYTKRAQLQGQLDNLHRQYLEHAETHKQVEQQLKAAGSGDRATLDALTQQRNMAASGMQSTELTAHPVRSALDDVEAKILAHQQQVAELENDIRRQQAMTDRQLSHHRNRAGSARGALQQALRSLAEAAIRADILPEGLAASRHRIEQQRMGVTEALVSESLHREAMAAFDRAAYGRGKAILIGGTALTFVALISRLFF